MNSIWTEKYRPQKLDDLIGNPQSLSLLRSQVLKSQHLLICGPAGVGKTSALHCLSREILREDYSQACLELNAADERGIDVVRARIKTFAKSVYYPRDPEALAKLDGKENKSGRKIIILDEVEAMTEAAQQALRRTMEVYANTTTFYLACNHSEKIIDPVQSRCYRINMMPLADEDMRSALTKICKLENVEYDDDALTEVITCASGDLRKGVGALQAAATAFNCVKIPFVYHACDMPPTSTLTESFDFCRAGKWREARNLVMKLVKDGYSGHDILRSLRNVVNRSSTTDNLKTQVSKEVTFAYMSTDRTIDLIQLDAVLCKICLICARVR